VTPETFHPINAGDLTMMLCFKTIGIREASKQPSEA